MTIFKRYRINNELSQKEMAEKLNVSLNAYRNYENGKRVITHEALIKFLNLRGYDKDLELAEVLQECLKKQ